ncbi:MAG: hypothetical protein AB1598_13730 [Thermodesulfobacteriota bacterium]
MPIYFGVIKKYLTLSSGESYHSFVQDDELNNHQKLYAFTVIWGKLLNELIKTLLKRVIISGRNGNNITNDVIANDIISLGRFFILNSIGASINPWSLDSIEKA